MQQNVRILTFRSIFHGTVIIIEKSLNLKNRTLLFGDVEIKGRVISNNKYRECHSNSVRKHENKIEQ